MNRLAEGVIEVGFPAQDQGKTVDGIIAVIHEHLDVIENTGAQVLCFINGKEQDAEGYTDHGKLFIAVGTAVIETIPIS